jgi:phosphoribosylglycinamide formyltransferase-1
MNNIVILISGSGSNMRALVEASRRDDWAARHGAQVSLVLSNRPDAGGLIWAREQGLPTAVVDHRAHAQAAQPREAFEAELAQHLDAQAPVLILLAGFMRILTPGFVARYAGRMLNIHPSLLPAFPGLHTHQRAIESGCRYAGATVHEVTAELDHGPILAQAVVPVLPDDDADTLAARVLSQEHRIYPQAVAQRLRQGHGRSAREGAATRASNHQA